MLAIKKSIKLFPLVIQYFNTEHGIQNKLIDFYENSKESANDMFEAIEKSLSDLNLSFNRVSGLSADNTNANFGIHHSLYKNIEDKVPHLIKGNCHAHIVHNCVKYSMNFLRVDVENIILKIYSHFSMSATRREELKQFVAAVDGEWHELKRHVGTRWLSLLPCVDNILINCQPIYNYFQSLDDDNCPVHIQNILLMNEIEGDKKLQCYLNFASHILHLFNKTIKLLEGNKTTVLDLYNIMTNLKTELEQRKNDKFFGFKTLQILKTMENEKSDIVIKNFELFIEKSLAYLNKWFNFDSSNWLYLLKNYNLKDDISFDLCVTLIEQLSLQEKLNIQFDELYSEVKTINQILAVAKVSDDFMNKNTDKKWQHIFQNSDSQLTNSLKIISYLLSIPATSAFTERIFSVMNVKWRDERNRANLNLIKNELLIYCNLDLDCNDSYNVFLNDAKLLKDAKSSKKYSFKNK